MVFRKSAYLFKSAILALFVLLVFVQSGNAATQCVLRDACLSDEMPMLSLYQLTDSHARYDAGGAYKVCCPDYYTVYDLADWACSGTDAMVVNLYAPTDSHVNEPGTTWFPQNTALCLQKPDTMPPAMIYTSTDCQMRAGSCVSNELCVLSLIQPTDSHAAECGAYSNNVCCCPSGYFWDPTANGGLGECSVGVAWCADMPHDTFYCGQPNSLGSTCGPMDYSRCCPSTPVVTGTDYSSWQTITPSIYEDYTSLSVCNAVLMCGATDVHGNPDGICPEDISDIYHLGFTCGICDSDCLGAVQCNGALRSSVACDENCNPKGPIVSVTGAPTKWVNTSWTAHVGCIPGPHACNPPTYRLQFYPDNPGVCSNDYTEYDFLDGIIIPNYIFLCAAAKDTANVPGFSLPKESLVDLEPPVISITISPDPPMLGEKINFTAIADDVMSGVDTINILVDGSPQKTCGSSMTTPFKYGGTFTDLGGGDNAWVNPSYAQTSNDQYATTLLDPVNSDGISGVLSVTNFGFAIPTDATIDGIIVATEKKSSVKTPTAGATDLSVKIIKGGAITGDEKASPTKYETSDTTSTYGTGTTDKWGATWTAEDINANNFGIAYSAQVTGTTLTTQTVSVDYISITVYYTAAATGNNTASCEYEGGPYAVTGSHTYSASANDTAGGGNQTPVNTFDVTACDAADFEIIDISPDPAQEGNIVTITFSTPDTLIANPSVSVTPGVDSGHTDAYPATFFTAESGRYVYTFTIFGSYPDGRARMVIEGTSSSCGVPGRETGYFTIVSKRLSSDLQIIPGTATQGGIVNAIFSCRLIDGSSQTPCTSGNADVTSIKIDDVEIIGDYPTPDLNFHASYTATNGQPFSNVWVFPINTATYHSSVTIRATHSSGLSTQATANYIVTSVPIPGASSVDVELEFPDVTNNIVPLTPGGIPNFTRSMPITIFAYGTINKLPFGKEECSGASCTAAWWIGATPQPAMSYDAFNKAFVGSVSSSSMACDTTYTLKVNISVVGSDAFGISTADFLVSCDPRLTVTPVESRVTVGDKNIKVFDATIWNPRDAAEYELKMETVRSEDENVLGWLELQGASGIPPAVTVSVGRISSETRTVSLNSNPGAGRSGAFGLKFTATAASTGSKYMAFSNLLVFAEGLDEFPVWYLVVLAIIAAVIYYKFENIDLPKKIRAGKIRR